MEIRIYQVDIEKDENKVAFLGLENGSLAKSQGNSEINSGIYRLAFYGSISANNLEDVYRVFNTIPFPPGIIETMRPMSVSDVVEVFDQGFMRCRWYYCDSIGFTEINFNPNRVEQIFLKSKGAASS